jgi:DNA damage-binding protein 1
MYLELDVRNDNKPVLQLVENKQMEHDVACISIRPLSIDSNQHPGGIVEMSKEEEDTEGKVDSVRFLAHSRLLAVAMWTDSTVRLLALPTLVEVGRAVLGVDTQARDLLLVEMAGVAPMLLVGFGDGVLIIYTVDFSSGLPNLVAKRKVVLGTQPLSFSCFSHTDALCVFISCDRPTVLYSRSGKVLFSVANVAEVTGMAPFHTELFPQCLALTSESGLRIGTVDDIQKIHVQTMYLGESPRRICYSSKAGVYVGEFSSFICDYILYI